MTLDELKYYIDKEGDYVGDAAEVVVEIAGRIYEITFIDSTRLTTPHRIWLFAVPIQEP